MKKIYSTPILTLVSKKNLIRIQCGHGAGCNGKDRKMY